MASDANACGSWYKGANAHSTWAAGMRRSIIGRVLGAGVLLLALAGAGCEGIETTPTKLPDTDNRGARPVEGSIFGGSRGIPLLGGSRDEGASGGIGVNSFLWRASIDTIAFMPLLSADPFGGVIITDWYAPPETPDERFKMTVYILDRALRADAVQVAVFRQERIGEGQWEDRSTSDTTAASLENKILDRARQLRTGSLGG